MANEFLSVKNIARAILPRLIENLVFPNLCYKDFSNDFELGKGATVQVRKPVTYTASEFDEASGVTAQDIKEQSVDVTLDKLATVDAEYGSLARATSVDDLNRLFVEPAAIALAEKINRDGLKLAIDVPYAIGTAGTTPDGLDDFANAAKVLDEAKVPTAQRYGIWDPTAMSKFRQIGDIVNAENPVQPKHFVQALSAISSVSITICHRAYMILPKQPVLALFSLTTQAATKQAQLQSTLTV